MKNGSFFLPREDLHAFCSPSAMNCMEGLFLQWETDPATARRVLPPQLELLDPAHPVVHAYVVNIREPTFAPWYMEGALMLICRYGDIPGAHFLNLQVSGPGANMALRTGVDSGLPKKLCERIVVERTDTYARAFIERKGRRIFDAELEVETRDDGQTGNREASTCFTFIYEGPQDSNGRLIFPKVKLMGYEGAMQCHRSEPARIASIRMDVSLDDPWAELAVVKPLAARYAVFSNPILKVSPITQFEGEEADNLFSYLFAGRFDRSTICAGNQQYGQF